jgi:LPS-assembly lipoprotein
MWWPSPLRTAALLLALPLAGCLQPMYGQFAEGGPGLDTELRAIAVEPIGDRIGHYLGDDLVFALNGTGSHPAPKYRLFVTLNEASQTPLIDTVSGRASSATVVVNATYRLEDFVTGLPVTRGTAFVFKSYDRTSQRYADVRAARDAEIRDAKQLADLLRLRLAAALADRRAGIVQTSAVLPAAVPATP